MVNAFVPAAVATLVFVEVLFPVMTILGANDIGGVKLSEEI